MRRKLAVLLFFAALPLFAGGHRSSRTVTINTNDDEPFTRCSQMSVLYDGERVPIIEEDVPSVRGLRSLSVHPPQNGGVHVVGTSDSGYSVTSCKAVVPGRDARDIAIDVRGDDLSARMPGDLDAVIYFIVRAPRNATLDLETHNGEIGVQDFRGTLTAHTQNGPISLKDVSGTITADAVNGPISFSGDSGVVKLDTQNGPLTIKLSGRSWLSGTLDGHAHNGPLSVRLPRDYSSGVVVDSDGYGPVSCRAEGCRQSRRASWDDDDSQRHIELGVGTAVVRLSAGNGPVSVRERD